MNFLHHVHDVVAMARYIANHRLAASMLSTGRLCVIIIDWQSGFWLCACQGARWRSSLSHLWLWRYIYCSCETCICIIGKVVVVRRCQESLAVGPFTHQLLRSEHRNFHGTWQVSSCRQQAGDLLLHAYRHARTRFDAFFARNQHGVLWTRCESRHCCYELCSDERRRRSHRGNDHSDSLKRNAGRRKSVGGELRTRS